MKFEIDEHYTHKTILKDVVYRGTTEVQVSHFANRYDTTPHSLITIETGACHIHARITSAEARDLATKLQAFAEEVDAHALQLSLDKAAA